MLPFSKTLIVLPTYNESTNIAPMIEALRAISPELQLLVIDDHSPDGTGAIVKTLTQKYSNVHLIERSGKLGLGTAYVLGFQWGLERGLDFMFSMDSDFSHPPERVPAMIEAAQTNDVAIGSRYVDGIRIVNWPLKRLLLSKFASFYVRLITGMPFADPTAGFNCFNRRALLKIDFSKVAAKGYNFIVEMKYRIWTSGGSLVEVPIIFYERREGVSKMSGKVIFESIINVIRMRLKHMVGLL